MPEHSLDDCYDRLETIIKEDGDGGTYESIFGEEQEYILITNENA